MAIVMTAYDHLWKILNTGIVDLDTDTLKVALVTSGYTPSIAHTQWADVSANEVANGSGYTTGGATLTGATVTNTAIGFSNPSWPSLTKTFRYAVCYAAKTAGGLTNPLLFYVLLDSTPDDVIQTNSNYEIKWHPTNKVIYRPT
ncbi:MAG: hypothetical protein ABTR07_09120 [Candidatus Competibacter denitrificans]